MEKHRSALLSVGAIACLIIPVLAFAAPTLPRPLENVTKLERPTICYAGKSGWGLYLIDWDGENNRLWISDKTRIASTPRWSPNGKRAALVAYSDEDGYTLFMIELETNKVINLNARLRDPKLILRSPQWSPDSNWIACTGNIAVERDHDIYKLHIPTGKLVKITSSKEYDERFPYFSPDGKKIAYYAWHGIGENETSDIFVMDADGKNKKQLTASLAQDSSPIWTPDGKRIIFDSYNRLGERLYDLFIMDADGSNLERFTFDRKSKSQPSWSPDGKWLIYDANYEWPLGNIYRMHVETKEVVRVSPVHALLPKWVLAGKSRFLSVDPAGKKKAQWGALKKADSSPNSPTPQDGE